MNKLNVGRSFSVQVVDKGQSGWFGSGVMYKAIE